MTNTAITIPAPAAPTQTAWPGMSLWHKPGGFGFHDVLDTLNPLQHIPIVGTIYRAITGDEPGEVPRIVGDGLFGGVYGLVGSLVNVLVQAETGEDIGEHVLTALGLGDGKPKAGGTAVAGTPVGTPAEPLVGLSHRPMKLSPSRYILPVSANGARGLAASGASGSASFDAPTGGAPSGAQMVTRPVPLQGMGMLLPNNRPRPLIAVVPTRASPALPGSLGTGSLAAGAGPMTAGPMAANPTGASPLVAPPAPGAPHVMSLPAPTPLVANPLAASPLAASPLAASPLVGGPATAAGPIPLPPVDPSGLPQNPPVEIPQKMMEALDKYAKMVNDRDGKSGTGGQVNLVQ